MSLICNAEVEGILGLDVRIEAGVVVEIGRGLRGAGEAVDAGGGALIPGLVDHHCHLFAAAAQADSVRLDDVAALDEVVRRIRAAAASRPAGGWIRATGCPGRLAEALARAALDAWAPKNPLRLQDQTGGLWLLNSAALALVARGEVPECAERAPGGELTGRMWRGDAWRGAQIGEVAPPFGPVGRRLATLGITAVTDASATTTLARAALLAQAVRDGALPQRLMLMSAGALMPPEDATFAVGPVKILLDDRDLLPLDEFVARIAMARRWGRVVAVHCVTAGELALTLAAFAAAGSRAGDRIEHGGVIPQAAIEEVRALGLTVVTQPGFIHERGERYFSEVDAGEQDDLYRCASLLAAGIGVAGSSDAPYGRWDCWAAMHAAVSRRTAAGRLLAAAECVSPRAALNLYLGGASDPGGPVRRVLPGAAADLCLLDRPLRDVLAAPQAEYVAMTMIAGNIVYQRG